MPMVVEDGKEVMVQLRLFYLGVVSSMKNWVEEKKNETPGGGRGEKVNFVGMKRTRQRIIF
jgi:hypothetical protein